MDGHQHLLQTPKASSSKILYIVLSSLALISTAFVSIYILNPTSLSNTTPLPLHICEQSTLDKESCSSMIMEAALGTTKPEDEVYLLESFLKHTKSHIDKTLEMASNFSRRINNPKDQAAIIDCAKLMDISKDRVMDSILALGDGTMISHQNAHAWLSSVLTNHVTCLDGLTVTVDFSRKMFSLENKLNELISRARISLAMLVAISPSKDDKLMEPLNGDFPAWVTSQDRRLLEALPNQINANVVVAKDGTGNYKTVKQALAAAPKKSKTRYVIYVKKGVYKENVEVGKDLKNIMLTGDGMDSTIITGSLNVVDGSTTFNSATVAAVGDGFIAQDIGFQNTAGPQKHQAVALRVGADQAVINRCRMDAYQDTLYTHSNRQFYRDSNVTGTVDFIFGNAAVVFQNCKLVARKPMSGQKNMVTAQGRTDPNQNTGTSIQKCEVIASSDLAPVKSSFPTYLGRPWKEYSRTVVMQSTIGDHIAPAGWAEWSGDFALKTLYYGEYANKGPGAGTSKRVKWSGYHVITSPAEAQKFTVAQLIQGGSWLKSTGVSYTEGL